MIEAHIIHALLSKQAWAEYSPILDWAQLKAQTPEAYRILLTLKKWHEEKTDDLSLAELPIWFFLQYPGLRDKEKDSYTGIFKQAEAAHIRPELVTAYLQQLKDVQTRRNIAVLAMDDKVPNEKVIAQIGQLSVKIPENATEETHFVTTNLDDLIAQDEATPGYTWRLECLNKSVGPLRKGMFGCILARVETGKTAMWVSEIANFAPQLKDDEHIAIFFNEENGIDVMWRIYSAITGWTAVELESKPKEAKELFYSRGGQRIRFVDKAHQYPKNIYSILDTLNPRIIVIDNLDKIKGFDSGERQDIGLGSVYQWARETAKIYAPVLGVSQSSITMQKKWLTDLDMANSKVAKPAELDFLIAIGRTDDAGYEYVRYINIPKNKRRGNKYCDEKDRHGKFQAIIIPELSLYKDA